MGLAGHLGPGRQSCCHHWGTLLGVGWTFLDPPGRCGGVRVLQGYKSMVIASVCAIACNGAAVCTANGIPRLKDRRVDSWVVMAWAYFCWRDGGGLVFASLTLALVWRTFVDVEFLAVCLLRVRMTVVVYHGGVVAAF
ncbi:hypothetical protein NDU88_005240 [Pleurodeles waltl]|uniref:Uncharacterized protein n=1 Tax=Pleurodeles waltl TaxID=8319 RepID=A0AAV7MVP4_PLEWA|nr:hypothetical protein NDU88_005240 [Pleurodeles waltl]